MADKKYILALDEGTTSARSILFDKTGRACFVAQKEFSQNFPQPGWVEHDPEEIWQAQLFTAKEVLRQSGADAEEIAAIGITNQRETTVVWDKETGKPVYPAIVWQCRRTADFCKKFSDEETVSMIKEKTGLTIDPYFSASKVRWILDNVEEAKGKELLFGTIDSWLVWKLTEGKVHITDYSNASRTLLFNIHTLCWDKELLKLFQIPHSMLPNVVNSSEIIGTTDLFGSPIPIAALAGDQHAALFGQCCFEAGEAKNTYGTGCFLLMNTGQQAVASKNGLVTTIAWGINGKITYALEGSVFVAGAAIQWLRDQLGIINNAAQTEELALSVPDTGGVYLVPAFSGLGAPYWDPYARGILTGLTRGSNRCHIARAALESIAYQSFDIFTAMEEDCGKKLISIKADGGAAANNFLMQFQADINTCKVERPKNLETTALGAAYLAGLSSGFWSNQEEIRKNWNLEKSFNPSMLHEEINEKLQGWKKAVEKSRN